MDIMSAKDAFIVSFGRRIVKRAFLSSSSPLLNFSLSVGSGEDERVVEADVLHLVSRSGSLENDTDGKPVSSKAFWT